MDAQPLYPFRKLHGNDANLAPSAPMKTQLKPALQNLADSIIRLHKTTVPTSTCAQTSSLAKIFTNALHTLTWPDIKKLLEVAFGKKAQLKKANIQGGMFGVTLVLRMFERLDLEGVGGSKGDCVSWIDKLCKAIDGQAEIYRQADLKTELARLSLYASAGPNDVLPRATNTSAIANFPSFILRLVLEQTFELRSLLESSFDPTSNAFERQNTRKVFQRVCFAWSGVVERSEVAVTGLAQMLRLINAFRLSEGGRTCSEVRVLTFDFRSDGRTNFDNCGKALGTILELCTNLESLEIVLPGPGVEGEEVMGLAALAGALDKTGPKVEKFIVRCVPEMRRNKNGTRKFATPLVLRLSILSPIICRTGLKHLEVHGIVIAKARLATKIQCRLEVFRTSWNGDNSSLFALLSASRQSLRDISLLEAFDPEAFSRVDLAEFLATMSSSLKSLTLIECDKALEDPNYIEKILPDLPSLVSLSLGSTGYTPSLFTVLPTLLNLRHITIELTRQFAPPSSGLWCLSEYLKNGTNNNGPEGKIGLKSFRIVPEPAAKVLMGNGSVWKLDRAAERGFVKLLLPSGWRI